MSDSMMEKTVTPPVWDVMDMGTDNRPAAAIGMDIGSTTAKSVALCD